MNVYSNYKELTIYNQNAKYITFLGAQMLVCVCSTQYSASSNRLPLAADSHYVHNYEERKIYVSNCPRL